MPNEVIHVAIVGCGPWGLCALERLHATAARCQDWLKLVVHVIDPGPPGAGVYSAELPEYLLLNTACGQIDLFASKILNRDREFPLPRPSFFEWLTAEGYRVREYPLAGESEARRPVRRSDFLPRRWLGRYLQMVFRTLRESLPPNLDLHVHAKKAVRVAALERGERILLEDFTHLDTDYAFLTLGHGESPGQQSELRELTASGEQSVVGPLAPGAPAALAGFGLTAIDSIAHLTLGTGGRFVRKDGRLAYEPTGREPLVLQFSRSGEAYRTRPHGSGDIERGVGETLLDSGPLRGLARERGKLDFRTKILPFVLREMRAHFDAVSSQRGERGSRSFDAHVELFGEAKSFDDEAAYDEFLARTIGEDIVASREGAAQNPRKAALESLRWLREPIRELADFGGLTRESFADFRRSFVPNVYRSIVGPPTQKLEEWAALRRAGLIRTPFGPDPRVKRGSKGWRFSSTRLTHGTALETERLLSGFAPAVDALSRRSALLAALLSDRRGRLLDPSGTLGCGLELDRGFHPVNAAGVERRLFVLGLLSEGARSFNLYVPSPGSRFRAFTDAQACVDELITRSAEAPNAAPDRAR